MVPSDHKLANSSQVSMKKLENEPFIFCTTECGLGETIKNFCEQANFNPHVTCECATPEVTRGLVEAKLGLAFLPEYIFSMDYTKNVSYIPIRNPKMSRTIWVSWSEDRYLTKSARSFIKYIFEYFSR